MPDLAIDRALAATSLELKGCEQIVRDAEKYEWPHLKEHYAHLSDLRAALAILEAARAWMAYLDRVEGPPIEGNASALYRAIRGEP